MSENESFLSRWARLKQATKSPSQSDEQPEQQPNAAAAPDPRPDAPRASSLPTGERSARDTGANSPAGKTMQAVDLATLPPLESIDAATDITAYLARGVPPELTQAALRRAWAADPAIRDFVGLAENAWDFTAPDAIPGFGPLGPAEEARQLLGQLFEPPAVGEEVERIDRTRRPADSPPQAEAPAPRDRGPAQSRSGDAPQDTAHEVVKSADDPSDTVAVFAETQRDNNQNKNEDVALQKINNSTELSAAARVRGHGGALPK